MEKVLDKKCVKYVSIIIPALNEEKHIGLCLESITENIRDRTLYEVILVDNGSSDNTLKIAEKYKTKLTLKILIKTNCNISKLRNMGVRHSKGNILAFLDADCTISKEWLNSAIPYFNRQSCAAAGSSHEIPPGYSWVAKTWDMVISKKRRVTETDNLPSGNMFVDKDKFNKVGGFDESLETNEDFDLCFRFRKCGFKLFSDPEISAFHWGAANTLSEFYRQCRWHGKSVLKVFLSDIKSLNNVYAVLYSIYFLLGIIGFIIGVADLFFYYRWNLVVTMLFALIIPPVLLSYKVLKGKEGRFKWLPMLSWLYFIYGIARANSLLDNLFKNNNNST